MNKKKHTRLSIRAKLFAASIVFVLLFSGCKQTVPDEGLVPGIPWLLGSTMFRLHDFGYEKAEYFIKGTAQSYVSAEPLTSDGKWNVEPADEADFRTRIVVYRPTDPEKFNGTVIVEWFNVSGGTEASSEWIMAHTELLRSGYAWIGVSAQKAGIDGAGVTVLPISLSLKKLNPARYSTLIHPGDQYAYDIFRQVGKAIVQPQNFNPLGELKLERAIASGESQSADYMMTYINAIAPRERIFDAYYIHSRIHGSAPLAPEPDASDLNFETRDTVRVRDDLDVPVMMLQTETDSTVLGAYLDSQPDTDMFRVWEVAGTAHADRYVGNLGLYDTGKNPSVANVAETRYAVPVIQKCGKPINSGPQHFVVKASIAALDSWLRTGVAPTPADRFAFDESTASFIRDEFGNVLGGIRTPYVDVPIATLSGEGQEGDLFCRLYGTTKLFDEATLSTLYRDHEAYVDAVSASVDDAVEKGFLLQPDGELIKASAQQSEIGLP
ncbi:hypothetical protein FT643_14905 [Ketobacter sp. MCCC 1A13808]|uniref:alpha/beta hydrolase domain-containing protein n=1 Tax=Ketobacter sp. MCCC 1A13808 TaxID=2602738 RepID=UPI000F1B1C38|nr:alpha/beta hydrolase domain-containing protein [Ketobacter sp. MCCC 1A13808]MVF13429.1 hypothetical protein [Ketobacter sp. MCCC 1A13808]RLP52948.1 MAG: hypothetical protein D6160_18220 [Ketobacter sp.]